MIAKTGIRFILNADDVEIDDSGGLLVLDFLRRRRRLTGTKEGCKEGDCGACCVLVGTLDETGELAYKPVTSCLLPLAELRGKHLVSIEGLNLPEALSPLQDAVVCEGGSQCGYCTPGIIVSMTHCLMEKRSSLTLDDMKVALSGNLCRCTGYSSLKRASNRMAELWSDVDRSADDGSFEKHIPTLVEKGILPDYFTGIPARLRELQVDVPPILSETPKAAVDFRIAGGTDLYVQRGEDIPDATIDVLNLYPEMSRMRRDADALRIGGLTTFEDVMHNADFRALVPHIDDFMHLIASLQIRNRATLAGNVINASPIGDMTMLLLALEAELTLKGANGSRQVPLRDFYRGYKELDKSADEVLTEFAIPLSDGDMRVNFEKVSKRKCLDIASVNSAIKLVTDGGIIRHAALAAGGVAPIPKFLSESSAYLVGKPANPDTVAGLLSLVQQEIAPISDVRGSADYKRLMTRQLVLSHFSVLFPDRIQAEEFV